MSIINFYNNSKNFLMLWNYFDYIVTGYIYIGMSLSRSSTLSINVLLIFEMNYLNRALFLYALSFSALPFSFAAAAAAKRSIVFSQQYLHHYSPITLLNNYH